MKLKQLEQQLAEIRETLNSGRARDSLQLSSTGERRPKVSFSYERADGPGASGGVIEAGDFGNGYEALRICTSGPTRLGLESDTDALLQAGGILHLNAPSIRIESRRVNLDGELAARLCSTEPFTWQSGQRPVRLVHQRHGIPVLTELKGKFKDNSCGIRMYVDPEDGYWYLTGDSREGAGLLARVICIGRV